MSGHDPVDKLCRTSTVPVANRRGGKRCEAHVIVEPAKSAQQFQRALVHPLRSLMQNPADFHFNRWAKMPIPHPGAGSEGQL